MGKILKVKVSKECFWKMMWGMVCKVIGFKFVEILEGMICKWFDISMSSNRSLKDGS